MEEQVPSLIELREAVERTEHECDNGKRYGDPADGSKLKHGQLVSILLEQNKYQINERDDAAENVTKDRIELEVLDACRLQSAFFGPAREHENDAHYSKTYNDNIQDYLNYGSALPSHKAIIARQTSDDSVSRLPVSCLSCITGCSG